MGLDGSVMCRCFEEGRANDPPMPRAWLHRDEDGQLTLLAEHDSNEACFTLDDWMQIACPHPGMEQAREFIANWPGYRAFQQALGHAGWGHFPTLQAELPQSGGDVTPPAVATLALQELADFRSLDEIGRDTFLVETATGMVLHRHIAAYDRIFLVGEGELRSGIGPFEFFIKDDSTGTYLFRSVHFRQTEVESLVELEDLDGGGTYRGPVAVRREIPWPDGRWTDDQGRVNYLLPTELHVESRLVTPAEFECILAALERLFRASVETGNPVRWS